MKKYETVNTKHGKAIVADTQTELENIAKQIDGDIVLLTRHDGEDSYNDLGSVVLPYEFGLDFTARDMKYGEDVYAYIIHNLSDYREAINEENGIIRETIDNDPTLIREDAKVIWELATFKYGDCMFLRFINGQQFYDTFRGEQTHWHDADVWDYRLAVVTL